LSTLQEMKIGAETVTYVYNIYKYYLADRLAADMQAGGGSS